MANGKKKEAEDIIISGNIKKFVLDTNVIIAFINTNHQFHLEAKTAINGIAVKKSWFIIPHIVLGEVIAHRDFLGSGSVSIVRALKYIDKFRSNIGNNLLGGPPISTTSIISNYSKHGRHHKYTQSGFSDFLILSIAEQIKNVRILTCDKGMYECGKSIFKKRIYYLPNNTTSIKSDYPRLMSEIQKDFV